jgi:hypothetical protein
MLVSARNRANAELVRTTRTVLMLELVRTTRTVLMLELVRTM